MSFANENKSETKRLESLIAKLDDAAWHKDIGGGWTIGTMICHLAFWDRMTSARIRFFQTHGRLTSVPDADNIEAINNSVRHLSEGLDRHAGGTLALKCAHEIDELAAALSEAERLELESTGRDRWFKRFLHRQIHLTRIERALAE